ncbi:MAG: PD40 domain-containing protein [Deltaproteobacteria bacterium]|nr:PD40 domain-containing protein [Deltaproteobacteria bacterium]
MAVAVLFATEARGANLYEAGHDWRQIRTDNFEVVYHEGADFYARKVAVIAEEVWPILTARLMWTPRGVVRIVISDQTDDSNGFSSPQPWNSVHIFLAVPNSDDRLDAYDDWLRLLLYHELTHTVHIDAVRAIPKYYRYLFGRNLFFNHLQPIYMIEGLAVFQESDLTTRGRNATVTSDMYLRTSAIERQFPTIDEAATSIRDWPSGAIPYIFGGRFHAYVAAHYGADGWGKVSKKHSGQIWPFTANHNAKKIFGKKMTALWDEFRYFEEAQGDAILERLRLVGLTPGRKLTKLGVAYRRPRWLDNDTLIVEERTSVRKPRILGIALPDGKHQTVQRTEALAGLAPLPDGHGIVFAALDSEDPWTAYNDLWFRSEDDAEVQLTQGARLRDPAMHPSGRYVVAVQQELGLHRLVKVDLPGGAMTPIFDYDRLPRMTQISRPAFSPDGDVIAMSIMHDDGNRDIFFYRPADDTFERVTAWRGRDLDAEFSPDGRTLFFVSDRSGIDNIYALDLKTRKLHQVTNVYSGAFDPAISPDGKQLAFIRYSSKGFDAHLMPLTDGLWRQWPMEAIDRDEILVGPISRDYQRRADALDVTPEDYSVGTSILPSSWTPLFSYSDISDGKAARLGFSIYGSDTLRRHSWALAYVHDFRRDFPNISATYAYDVWRPTIRVSAAHTGLNYGDFAEDENGEKHPFFLVRDAAALGASYAFTEDFGVFANFLVEHYDDFIELSDEPINRTPDTGWQIGPRVGFSFSNIEGYARSIAPMSGGIYTFTAAFDNHIFGSDYDVMAGIASARQFIGLPWYQNSIELSLYGGASQGDRLYRRNTFRLGGFTQGDLTAETSTNRFRLRGYESGDIGGERAVVGSVDYHTPIWYQQTGLGTGPIFFDTLSGALFASAGTAWRGDLTEDNPDELYESYGFELSQSIRFAYYSSFSIRFIFAHAPDREDPNSYYIGTGSFF